MKKYLIFFLFVLFGTSIYAQSDIKIMNYNLLIYPQGQMVNRIDTLSKILDYYEPDLLLLQELKSAQGLQDVVQELNSLFGNYNAGTYVPQVSNPSNSWRLQQNLVYNASVFDLISEETIVTPYRDINYFELRVLEPDGTPSTEIIHTYVTHLKSSWGTGNEQLRLSMAQVLMNDIATLPPASNIIVAGDFNVYYSAEPAYQALLSTSGSNTLHDPIDMPGWGDSNFPNTEVFTQSTRLSSLGDGSGGGVDDRFDFILLSDQLMDPNARIVYQDDSYKALGNNGTCYNVDLINCTTTNNVPYDILRSIYHMSDHTPVVLTLDFDKPVSTIDLFDSENQLIQLIPNPANAQIDLVMKHETKPMELRIFNLQGTLVLEQKLLEDNTTINITHLPLGLYFVQFMDNTGVIDIEKLLIQR